MIWETLSPRLFFRKTKTLSPIVRDLITMPSKKSGLGLLNPVTSAQEKYLSSQGGSTELIWDVTVGGAFSNSDHLRTIGEEIRDGNKDREALYKTKLKGLVRDLKSTNRHLILRAKITGAWMSVRGTIVPGTVLYATEFRDLVCARYNLSPLNLQSYYDGCGTAFGVMHALRFSIGVLAIACHNKIHDELLYLPQRDFTSAYVRAEPLIHQGRTRSKKEILQVSDKDKETHGGVIVRGLWYFQVDAIIDSKIGDADADSYKYEPISALLSRWETIKKDKDGKHCHNQRKQFLPFVISLDGMIGREYLVVITKLS